MNGLRLDSRRAWLVPGAAVLVPAVWLAACTKEPPTQERPPATVSVVAAKRARVPYVIEANGVVTPVQSAAVTSQVNGIVLSVDFQEGDEVRTGQPLFHIDPRPYQNAYDQALAVLARDSANAARATQEADRTRKLLDERVITPQEASAQLTAAAAAEATMRADRAMVANARFDLDNTVVRAPISGKTGRLLIKRGNMVRAGGGSPLVVINQVRPIYVRFAVPSSQLGLLLQYGARGGLPVAAVPGGIAPPTPSIDSLAAAATQEVVDEATRAASGGPNVGAPSSGAGRAGRGGAGTTGGSAVAQQGAFGGERVMGKLSFIDNAVDTATGTVRLKAIFSNADGRLWAGQFASTSLHLFDQDSALVVPQQAIVAGQRGTYVYVVDQADTARQRAVTVDRMADGLAIVSSGLRDGDRVVTDGQSRLTPDAPVRLRGAGANDAAGGRGGRRGRGARSGAGT